MAPVRVIAPVTFTAVLDSTGTFRGCSSSSLGVDSTGTFRGCSAYLDPVTNAPYKVRTLKPTHTLIHTERERERERESVAYPPIHPPTRLVRVQTLSDIPVGSFGFFIYSSVGKEIPTSSNANPSGPQEVWVHTRVKSDPMKEVNVTRNDGAYRPAVRGNTAN